MCGRNTLRPLCVAQRLYSNLPFVLLTWGRGKPPLSQALPIPGGGGGEAVSERGRPCWEKQRPYSGCDSQAREEGKESGRPLLPQEAEEEAVTPAQALPSGGVEVFPSLTCRPGGWEGPSLLSRRKNPWAYLKCSLLPMSVWSMTWRRRRKAGRRKGGWKAAAAAWHVSVVAMALYMKRGMAAPPSLQWLSPTAMACLLKHINNQLQACGQ